jgi:hypothetical protein
VGNVESRCLLDIECLKQDKKAKQNKYLFHKIYI